MIFLSECFIQAYAGAARQNREREKETGIMSNGINAPLGVFHAGAHELRRHWGWLLLWGIVLIVLGAIALADSVFVTVISMFPFGWVLLIAGIVEAVQAVRHRKAGHHFLHAMNAVLGIVVGFMLLRNSLVGALVVTLLLSVYFVVAGIFRIVSSLAVRVPGRGWALTSGIITLILGILVWAQWPVSGLWIIGMFIGIDLVLLGWSRVALALALRRIPA
jgi:uncharacterized membrane protein HdeD (DUF308 family)